MQGKETEVLTAERRSGLTHAKGKFGDLNPVLRLKTCNLSTGDSPPPLFSPHLQLLSRNPGERVISKADIFPRILFACDEVLVEEMRMGTGGQALISSYLTLVLFASNVASEREEKRFVFWRDWVWMHT